jgi:hypothetical protein
MIYICFIKQTKNKQKTNNMNTSLTLEQLSETIAGKLWIKGDMKRIYLDRGFNTKKMSTKAFIFEKEGEFLVSCRIECPSQDYNWISSQEKQVRESILSEIEEILNPTENSDDSEGLCKI